jgi:uncharacterized protein YqhQ
MRIALRETTGVQPTIGSLSGTLAAFGVAVLTIFVVAPGAIFSAPALTLWDDVSADLLESGLRVAIFLAYLAAVSQSHSARRLFAYHGAEHKVVAAFERHERLPTEAEARLESPVHLRCGTNFLALFVLWAAVLYGFAPQGSVVVAIIVRIVGLPIVVAFAYETMRAIARSPRAWWARLVSWPGRMLQRLTTREPAREQIEVALARAGGVKTRVAEELGITYRGLLKKMKRLGM